MVAQRYVHRVGQSVAAGGRGRRIGRTGRCLGRRCGHALACLKGAFTEEENKNRMIKFELNQTVRVTAIGLFRLDRK